MELIDALSDDSNGRYQTVWGHGRYYKIKRNTWKKRHKLLCDWINGTMLREDNRNIFANRMNTWSRLELKQTILQTALVIASVNTGFKCVLIPTWSKLPWFFDGLQVCGRRFILKKKLPPDLSLSKWKSYRCI